MDVQKKRKIDEVSPPDNEDDSNPSKLVNSGTIDDKGKDAFPAPTTTLSIGSIGGGGGTAASTTGFGGFAGYAKSNPFLTATNANKQLGGVAAVGLAGLSSGATMAPIAQQLQQEESSFSIDTASARAGMAAAKANGSSSDSNSNSNNRGFTASGVAKSAPPAPLQVPSPFNNGGGGDPTSSTGDATNAGNRSGVGGFGSSSRVAPPPLLLPSSKSPKTANPFSSPSPVHNPFMTIVENKEVLWKSMSQDSSKASLLNSKSAEGEPGIELNHGGEVREGISNRSSRSNSKTEETSTTILCTADACTAQETETSTAAEEAAVKSSNAMFKSAATNSVFFSSSSSSKSTATYSNPFAAAASAAPMLGGGATTSSISSNITGGGFAAAKGFAAAFGGSAGVNGGLASGFPSGLGGGGTTTTSSSLAAGDTTIFGGGAGTAAGTDSVFGWKAASANDDNNEDAAGGEDSDNNKSTEYDPDGTNQKVISLPENVTVLTGEEAEDCVTQMRAKLFRLSYPDKDREKANNAAATADMSVFGQGTDIGSSSSKPLTSAGGDNDDTTSNGASSSCYGGAEWVEVGIGPLKVLCTTTAETEKTENEAGHDNNQSNNDEASESGKNHGANSGSRSATCKKGRIVMRREDKKCGTGTKLLLNARLDQYCSAVRQSDKIIRIMCVNAVPADTTAGAGTGASSMSAVTSIDMGTNSNKKSDIVDDDDDNDDNNEKGAICETGEGKKGAAAAPILTLRPNTYLFKVKSTQEADTLLAAIAELVESSKAAAAAAANEGSTV